MNDDNLKIYGLFSAETSAFIGVLQYVRRA